MELNINNLHVVHMEEKVLAVFDNVEEALTFADGSKRYNTKVAVDPLRNYFHLYGCSRIIQLQARKEFTRE